MIWIVISTSNWQSRQKLNPNEKLELEWGEYHARGVHKKNSRRYAGPKKEICDSDVTVIGIMSYRLSLKPLFVWQSSSQNQISPWIGAKGIHTRWNYKQGNGSMSHCLHRVGLELTWEPQPMPAHFTLSPIRWGSSQWEAAQPSTSGRPWSICTRGLIVLD